MPPPDDDTVTGPAGTQESSVSDRTKGKPVRYFTWKELSTLNRPENAHVAVRGKVSRYRAVLSCTTASIQYILSQGICSCRN